MSESKDEEMHKSGKIQAFYGDLVSNAIAKDIINVTSKLDSLSTRDLYALMRAIGVIGEINLTILKIREDNAVRSRVIK